MDYNTDLFYKELSNISIDEEILKNAILPEFTEEERLKHESNIDLKLRRHYVTTHEGTFQSAFYTNKDVKDLRLVTHARELLGVEHYLYMKSNGEKQKPNMVRQWVWGSHSLTAHTDEKRIGQFIYILELGGDNVQTNWFIEPGRPIMRKYERYLTCIEDTRHLEKVCSVILKPKTWYYFNTAVIHNVTNIQSMRSAICVDAWQGNPYQKLNPS